MKATEKETTLIKSFEEACKIKGYDPEAVLPDVSLFPEKHQKALLATSKMLIIAEVLNDGWEPDWNDNDEYKYFPWFDMVYHKKNNPSGFRFSVSVCVISFTYTSGGSRLCFRTRALAEYAGKQFVNIYRDMMIIPK
jgi:hypothetical protein